MKLALEVIQDYVDEYGPHDKDSGAQYVMNQLEQAIAESEKQQRTWVGLTDEEIQAEWLLTPQHDKAEGLWFGRRLEAKLKEKNT